MARVPTARLPALGAAAPAAPREVTACSSEAPGPNPATPASEDKKAQCKGKEFASAPQHFSQIKKHTQNKPFGFQRPHSSLFPLAPSLFPLSPPSRLSTRPAPTQPGPSVSPAPPPPRSACGIPEPVPAGGQRTPLRWLLHFGLQLALRLCLLTAHRHALSPRQPCRLTSMPAGASGHVCRAHTDSWAGLSSHAQNSAFFKANNVFIHEYILVGAAGGSARGLFPPSAERWSRLKA